MTDEQRKKLPVYAQDAFRKLERDLKHALEVNETLQQKTGKLEKHSFGVAYGMEPAIPLPKYALPVAVFDLYEDGTPKRWVRMTWRHNDMLEINGSTPFTIQPHSSNLIYVVPR